MIDTYVAYTATSKLSFGLDVNYVTNEVNQADPALSLQGIGAYARYQVSSPAALAVRYERLDDEGLFGGIDQVLQEVDRDARIQVRRRLPDARRVPPRLVERAVLHRSAARRSARTTRTPRSSAWCGGSATSREPGNAMLIGMIVLGLVDVRRDVRVRRPV